MKKYFLLALLGLVIAHPSNAQTWNSWDTRSTIDGVLNLGRAVIESAERKKEMEIQEFAPIFFPTIFLQKNAIIQQRQILLINAFLKIQLVVTSMVMSVVVLF